MQNIKGIRNLFTPKNLSFVNTFAQRITQFPLQTRQSPHPTKAESAPAETTDAIHRNTRKQQQAPTRQPSRTAADITLSTQAPQAGRIPKDVPINARFNSMTKTHH